MKAIKYSFGVLAISAIYLGFTYVIGYSVNSIVNYEPFTISLWIAVSFEFLLFMAGLIVLLLLIAVIGNFIEWCFSNNKQKEI